jgi:hypothetical protein
LRVCKRHQKKAEHGGQMPTPAKRIKAQFELPFWRLHTPYDFLLSEKQSDPRPGAMRPCAFFCPLAVVENGVSQFHPDNTTQLLFCRTLEHDLLCIFKELLLDEK